MAAGALHPRARRWPLLVGALGLLLAGASGYWLRGEPADSLTPERRDALARAHRFLDGGRPDLAIRAVRGIPPAGPGAAEAYAIAGMSYAQLNQVLPAREALAVSLRLNPRQPEVVRVLAAIYLSFGDAAEAIQLLHLAAWLDSADSRCWLMMGRAYHDLGDFERSIQAYQSALARRADHIDAIRGLVRELVSAHRCDQAGPLIARGLKLPPSTP